MIKICLFCNLPIIKDTGYFIVGGNLLFCDRICIGLWMSQSSGLTLTEADIEEVV